MKTAHYLLIGAVLVALSALVSCKKGGLPDNFPEGCPNFTEHAYAGDLVDAMAPGIYEFRTSEGFGDTAVLAKSTDGWVFYVDNIDFIKPNHSNFIGSWLYYGFYATDNDKSSYTLYGEIIPDFGKAQYYAQREFLSREAMYKGITTAAGCKDESFNFAIKASQGILDYPMAMSHVAYHYDTFLDEWGQTYDSTICGIPVTCYVHEGHRYFVDKNWMCLYHKNYGLYSDAVNHDEHRLLEYHPAGNHEETYAKIYELYGNSRPKPEWNTCVKDYRKQADEWLTDEYPRTLDDWFKVYQGQGTIHDMEIGRRYPWNPLFDRVCGITVVIENVPYDDAIAYKITAMSVCNEVYEDTYDPDTKTLCFKGEYDPEDISGISFGDSYFHPGYEITLNKEGTLTIKFDVIKTTVV
ncbi:MAG: hypothetical protein J6P73_03665 [Bacteroidales bacterium]|nr:hypothetical protein [Bacteroidales bacterium]